jgi:hypothetical protein
MGFPRITLMLVALLLGSAAGAAGQSESAPAPPVAITGAETDPLEPADVPIDTDALPININRIRRAVSRQPAIRPESTRPVFRVQVFSRKPTIDDILGPDWRKGPTPAGPMTHQEFLDLVTPTDVKGYAAFDNKQALVVAATSFALQWAVTRAMDKLKDAVTERQKNEARKEVDEALAALKKARLEAGLPDR